MVARAGRSRFFACLGLLLLMVGFVTMFHNSQQQLDELRQLGLRCEQQQKSVQAQMEVIVDQKLRLENSLESERMINEANRKEQKQKAKEEQEEHSKSSMEANIRYASLQQQCNLVKSQLGDLTEECGRSRKQQSEEVNALRLKVSELQGKVQRYKQESTNDAELLKAQIEQLKSDKLNLEASLRRQISEKDHVIEQMRDLATKMEKENANYLEHCKLPAEQRPPQHHRYRDVLEALSRGASNAQQAARHDFNEQLSIIPKPLPAMVAPQQQANNVLQEPHLLKTSTSTSNGNQRSSDRNLQLPILAAPTVLPGPSLEHSSKRTSNGGGGGGGTLAGGKGSGSSSTSTTTTSTSAASKAAGAAPNRSAGSVARKPLSNRHTKPVPVGIVPFPDIMPDLEENISENVLDNRYANVAAAAAAAAAGGAAGSSTGGGVRPPVASMGMSKKGRSDNRQPQHRLMGADLNFLHGGAGGVGANVADDNGAHEVQDAETGAKRSAIHGALDGADGGADPGDENQLGNENNLNAAEEDTNLYDNGNDGGGGGAVVGNNRSPQQQQQPQQQQLDYNDVMVPGHALGAVRRIGAKRHEGGGGVGGAGGGGPDSKGALIDRLGDKLINEIAHDHGKEGDNYPNEMEDLHLVGNEAEEEDVSDYDDPTALKQGHAERN